MRKILLILVVDLLFSLFCSAQTNQFPAGLIYGPKGAYKIAAPKNWVLDNRSGLSMGLPCVLYLNGYLWDNSPVIMYAKIASPEFEKVDKFIDFAIKEFKKEAPNFYHKELMSQNLDNKKFVIIDYQGGSYKNFERVVYIQMEKSVGYVVFSAPNESDFKKYSDAIIEIIESFEYKPEYIGFKENK